MEIFFEVSLAAKVKLVEGLVKSVPTVAVPLVVETFKSISFAKPPERSTKTDAVLPSATFVPEIVKVDLLVSTGVVDVSAMETDWVEPT